MQLTSTAFFLFVSLVIFIYFIVKKEFQWYILLFASYIFYFIASPKTLIYLIITTISTFLCGIVIDHAKNAKNTNNSSTNEDKKFLQRLSQVKNIEIIAILIASLINLGILAYFKYYDFFLSNFRIIAKLFSANIELPLKNLLLPLGISFYTFQSLGYLIDIKRGRIRCETNIGKFALFVSFFPQIIQGPISKYSDLAKQLYEKHPFDFKLFKFGSQLMLWGYFKKIVIADRVALVVNSVFDNYIDYDGVHILMAALLYSIQIYCDFSGGIDIFRGIAEIMEITLPENFRRPFLSLSVEEYWRRWHITLGEWVRNYIFYPLALSKNLAKLGRNLRKLIGNYLGKLVPTFIATIITFLIIGIWHGPLWKYVAFGLFHGLIIIMEITFRPIMEIILDKCRIKREVFSWRLFKASFTFLIVSIGRYFVRSVGLKQAFEMLNLTFTNFNFQSIFNKKINLGIDDKDSLILFISIAILLFIEILQESGMEIRKKIQEQNYLFRWLLLSIFIMLILIFGIYGIGFDAKDFIYRGF